MVSAKLMSTGSCLRSKPPRAESMRRRLRSSPVPWSGITILTTKPFILSNTPSIAEPRHWAGMKAAPLAQNEKCYIDRRSTSIFTARPSEMAGLISCLWLHYVMTRHNYAGHLSYYSREIIIMFHRFRCRERVIWPAGHEKMRQPATAAAMAIRWYSILPIRLTRYFLKADTAISAYHHHAAGDIKQRDASGVDHLANMLCRL